MKSKITGGETELIFTGKILSKYDVNYYKCLETGFIQTEEPHWLEEAYSSAITKLDVGLAYRNEHLRGVVSKVISTYFNADGKFLDYAGGYGLFTRMMRDLGFDFYHTDPYCANIFAEYFDLKELNKEAKFEMVTAFEVLEHLPNPLEEIKSILGYSDNFLFTTELQPNDLNGFGDWWYFSPETGQHIALYTEKALQYIADKLGYYFYTDKLRTHLFTKHKLESDPFELDNPPYLIRTMKRKVDRYFRKSNPVRQSLIANDWEFIKNKLK